MSDFHTCPVRDCQLQVHDHFLMCSRHWRRVSRSTQVKVYRAYRAAPRSAAHVAICKVAIAEAEAQS